MAVKKYIVLEDFQHDPLDNKSYTAGQVDTLRGWRKADIASAIKVGLVKEFDDGKDRSEKR